MPDKKNRCRYRLKVTLLEDMHTGTGTGSANVDAVQKRDRRGLPVIRETHYKGVLRYHATALSTNETELEDKVLRLFGEKFRGKGPGQRGALILESLYLESWGKSENCLIWSSTARQLEQRAPMPETLRSREFIPAGSVFAGKVLLRDERYADLLKRCVRHMDALGAERQRGSGLVQVKWGPDRSDSGSGNCNAAGSYNQDSGLVRLRLVLRNLDPLSLPVTGYAGNVIPTECYIRGQALLGALADWAKDMGAAPDLLFRHGTGDVRIGNAYPLPEEVEGGNVPSADWDLIPMPLPLKTRKPTPEGDVDWPWWAVSGGGAKYLSEAIIDDLNPGKREPSEKPKRPKDREFLFRAADSDAWTRYAPLIQDHLRSQVPEERTDKDEGELFSMEEIAEKTCFLADIEFTDAATAQQFAEAFAPVIQHGDWLAMGRGRRPVVVEKYRWMNIPRDATSISKDRLSQTSVCQEGDFEFTLLLESDLLARSSRKFPREDDSGTVKVLRLPNLSHCDTLDPDLLIELAELDENAIADSRGWVWKATTDTVEVRGYNAATRLPRAPALGIRRGSAIRIAGKGAVKLYDALYKRPYLGERGREGFGRFRLFTGNFPIPKPTKENGSPGQITLEATRQLGARERLLKDAESMANRILEKGANKLPSRAQWMDLRTLVRVSPDQKLVLRRMEEHGKSRGGAKWKNAGLEKLQQKLSGFGEDGKQARLFLDSLIRFLLSDQRMKPEK